MSITIQNMSNRDLVRILRLAGACSAAMRWLGDRDLKTAILDCEDWSFVDWAAESLAGKWGFPLYEQYRSARKPIDEQYRSARKTIYEQYESARKPIDEQYESARKTIYEQYESARKTMFTFEGLYDDKAYEASQPA